MVEAVQQQPNCTVGFFVFPTAGKPTRTVLCTKRKYELSSTSARALGGPCFQRITAPVCIIIRLCTISPRVPTLGSRVLAIGRGAGLQHTGSTALTPSHGGRAQYRLDQFRGLVLQSALLWTDTNAKGTKSHAPAGWDATLASSGLCARNTKGRAQRAAYLSSTVSHAVSGILLEVEQRTCEGHLSCEQSGRRGSGAHLRTP